MSNNNTPYVISHRSSNDSKKLLPSTANYLKKMGIQTFAVGVGEANKNELEVNVLYSVPLFMKR